MTLKIFVDTNILVYMADPRHSEKQRTAQEAVRKLETGVISTQVVSEFYVTIINKLGASPFEAKRMMLSLLDNFEMIVIDSNIIKEAVDISILNQISYWDGLIVAAAQAARCDQIWSEDFSHNQMFKTVKIENIFK